ncbi:MAG: hypothetical protein MHM6MM_001645, partial [Cercozoa sp. M6MM]
MNDYRQQLELQVQARRGRSGSGRLGGVGLASLGMQQFAPETAHRRHLSKLHYLPTANEEGHTHRPSHSNAAITQQSRQRSMQRAMHMPLAHATNDAVMEERVRREMELDKRESELKHHSNDHTQALGSLVISLESRPVARIEFSVDSIRTFEQGVAEFCH